MSAPRAVRACRAPARTPCTVSHAARALLLVLLCTAALQAQTTERGGDPAAASAPAPVASPEPRPDLRTRTGGFEPTRFNLAMDGGRGLIRALSPYTLRPWEVGFGASVLNFDRNPGDVDFFEYVGQLTVGLPGRVEVFFRVSPVLRTNSVNQEPIGYPVPPLDLFVDIYPTEAQRAEPYFLLTQEAPYKSYYLHQVRTIKPPGHGAFASSSGDHVLGGKVNLLDEDRGDRLGVGLRVYLEIPTQAPLYNTDAWRAVPGLSGEVDFGFDALAAKRVPWGELLFNVGYKQVGDPERGLRVQLVDSSRWDEVTSSGAPASILVGAPIEQKLDLRNQIVATIGTAIPAVNVAGLQFWLLPELSYLRYVGGGTPSERFSHPLEMRLGVQANVPKFPALSLGAAWQLLFNDAGHGGTRRTPFVTPDGRGDINFGENVDPALSGEVGEMLRARGAVLSENASRVFATNNPRFDSLRNIETGPTPVIGMGGGNILAFVTWRIR